MHHTLWFPKGSKCILVGFSDSDFAKCKSYRKSTSDTCHIFVKYLVSSHNKKKHCVSLSNVEAQYVAMVTNAHKGYN